MGLELFKRNDEGWINTQEGLRELGELAYSMRENLLARVETPILPDGTKLWETWINSKTMSLYGGLNEDNRPTFKIDDGFDLSKITDAEVISMPDKDGRSFGAIKIDEEIYMQSQGVEFIIINFEDIEGTRGAFDYEGMGYAIRAGKYSVIRGQLNKGGFKAEELKEAGGFKICTHIKSKDVIIHDGWLELAVGKNNASEEDYADASQFLKEGYIPRARRRGCFSTGDYAGKGMPFYIDIETDYLIRPWHVYSNTNTGRSYVNTGRFRYSNFGCFLREVPEDVTQN